MKMSEILAFAAMMIPTLVVSSFAILTVVLHLASATPADAARVDPQIAYTATACTVKL